MELGTLLKEARKKSQKTQEEVADYLGVSRQSVSNWETNKSYPDIRSVVRLSDHYNLSLDTLLKGKEGDDMSDYLNYLEENTRAHSQKDKLIKIIMLISFMGVWGLGLLLFWLMPRDLDAGPFINSYFIFSLPLIIFIHSIVMGFYDYFGKKKYLGSLFMSVMYVLGYAFSMTIDLYQDTYQLTLPHILMMSVPLLISLLGIGLGKILYIIVNKKVIDEKKLNIIRYILCVALVLSTLLPWGVYMNDRYMLTTSYSYSDMTSIIGIIICAVMILSLNLRIHMLCAGLSIVTFIIAFIHCGYVVDWLNFFLLSGFNIAKEDLRMYLVIFKYSGPILLIISSVLVGLYSLYMFRRKKD